MRCRERRRALLAAAVVLGLASPAWADVGVPMLAIVWPVSWALLVPIVVAEWLVARRVLPGPGSRRLRGVVLANLLSTFVGIPVTWGGLLLVEFLAFLVGAAADAAGGLSPAWGRLFVITFGAPWLPPFIEGHDWMVPAAALTLLVPFYFMSVRVEAWAFQRVTDCPPDAARRWSRAANGVSYGALVLLVAGVLVHTLATS